METLECIAHTEHISRTTENLRNAGFVKSRIHKLGEQRRVADFDIYKRAPNRAEFYLIRDLIRNDISPRGERTFDLVPLSGHNPEDGNCVRARAEISSRSWVYEKSSAATRRIINSFLVHGPYL